jgi:hypothetical protein
MAYELKELQGSLFTNERKEKETHPDWQGTCKVDGKEYWISAWEKEGAKGKFFSLAFKSKDQAFSKLKEEVKPKADFDDSDSIPF